jgi:hypothetical protein
MKSDDTCKLSTHAHHSMCGCFEWRMLIEKPLFIFSILGSCCTYSLFLSQFLWSFIPKHSQKVSEKIIPYVVGESKIKFIRGGARSAISILLN